MHNSFWWNL